MILGTVQREAREWGVDGWGGTTQTYYNKIKTKIELLVSRWFILHVIKNYIYLQRCGSCGYKTRVTHVLWWLLGSRGRRDVNWWSEEYMSSLSQKIELHVANGVTDISTHWFRGRIHTELNTVGVYYERRTERCSRMRVLQKTGSWPFCPSWQWRRRHSGVLSPFWVSAQASPIMNWLLVEDGVARKLRLNSNVAFPDPRQGLI